MPARSLYPDSIARAAARGISTPAALADNDAYGFFAALGDLVVTGPTLTNVNDFRAILVARLSRVPAGDSRCGASAAPRSSRPSAPPARARSGSAPCSTPASMCSGSISATARMTITAPVFEAIRQVENDTGRPIGILADLQGPKLRLGTFAGRPVELAGRRTLPPRPRSTGPAIRHRAPLPHPEIFAALEPGTELLLDDGKVRLQVESCGTDFAETACLVGGTLSDRKGVNVPNAVLPLVGAHREGPRRPRLRARSRRRLDRAVVRPAARRRRRRPQAGRRPRRRHGQARKAVGDPAARRDHRARRRG